MDFELTPSIAFPVDCPFPVSVLAGPDNEFVCKMLGPGSPGGPGGPGGPGLP